MPAQVAPAPDAGAGWRAGLRHTQGRKRYSQASGVPSGNNRTAGRCPSWSFAVRQGFPSVFPDRPSVATGESKHFSISKGVTLGTLKAVSAVGVFLMFGL